MKYTGIELIRELSLAFGPSGCEDAVRNIIAEQIKGECDNMTVDKAGNLIAVVRGRGNDFGNPVWFGGVSWCKDGRYAKGSGLYRAHEHG